MTQTRTQHTPGPWEVHDTPGTYWKGFESPIPIAAGRVVLATARDKDNARLIAAAPDLLAACKRLLEHARGKACDDDCLCKANARAAIAKARPSAP